MNRQPSRHRRNDSGHQHGDLTGITDRMGNVLEQVTEKHYPAIVQIKKDMRRLGAVNALMSGSGSTVFGIFTSREAAGKAAEFFP